MRDKDISIELERLDETQRKINEILYEVQGGLKTLSRKKVQSEMRLFMHLVDGACFKDHCWDVRGQATFDQLYRWSKEKMNPYRSNHQKMAGEIAFEITKALERLEELRTLKSINPKNGYEFEGPDLFRNNFQWVMDLLAFSQDDDAQQRKWRGKFWF